MMTTVEDRLRSAYDEEYFAPYENDPMRRAMFAAEYAKVRQLRPLGGRVLDVGCGDGGFLDIFDRALWEPYGIDVSEVAIARARSRGIQVRDYEQGYDYPPGTFDVIVCRGALQHLDTPFWAMKRCIALLKEGGLFAFLATPNANSICYRLFGTLPFLDPKLNFYIPSDTTLPNALINFGMRVVRIDYPYRETPYANLPRDHWRFLLRLCGIKTKFPFWGNVIDVFAAKPLQFSG